MATHSKDTLTPFQEDEKLLEKNPDNILEIAQKRHWSALTQRFLRVGVMNGFFSDVKSFLNEKVRSRFTRLARTGTHEAGHMYGASRVATLLGAKVNEDGSGVTHFRMSTADSFYHFVRNINYIGFLGKAAEEALGLTPHGHGFDMAQNDAYADYYTRRTGESGSAVQMEASSMASSDARSNIDSFTLQGVRLALAAGH